MQQDGFNRGGEVYFALCKAVDSPVSLGLWLRFKHGEHQQLAEFSIRPEGYCNAWSFQKDYLCSEYFSKYKGLSTGLDVKAVALRSFATNESVCHSTNIRLREARLRGFSPRVEAVMFTAKRKIATLLGTCDFEKWSPYCKWGPGATYSLKGVDAHLDNKIREDRMSITAAALPYFRRVISDDYAWLSSRGVDASGPCCLLNGDVEVVEGCRVTTVPKNAKTERTIAIEPTLNQFLQGGIGGYIRRRLKRTGIDLNDQVPNQTGAREALTRRLATVDLKAASDTVSMEVVYDLLPLDWVLLMDCLRSRKYQMPDGSWHLFEKFSTMGNGFTFELESLIFWALSSAVLEVLGLKEQVLVYGDDIIIADKALPLLIDVFTECGFTVNSEKTHFDSAFRESCGKHFFAGCDVTPVYQKEVPDVLEEVYRLANRLRRLAYFMGDGNGCMGILRNAWLAAIRNVRIRHATPIDSEDDDGLALPFDEIENLGLVRSSGPYGVTLPVLSFKPTKLKLQEHGGLLAYWLRFSSADLVTTPEHWLPLSSPESLRYVAHLISMWDDSLEFKGAVAVRRRGKYVSRRRKYRVGCRSAPWLLDGQTDN